MLCADYRYFRSINTVVDIFNASTGIWSTAALSVARYYLAATSLPNQGLAIFAGGSITLIVDIFNAITGVWTKAGSTTVTRDDLVKVLP